MSDEQNDKDIRRMTKKRTRAIDLLYDFKEWYHLRPSENLSGDGILVIGLMRDILSGTEDEVDRLIIYLDERCQQALFKKIASSVDVE